MSIKGFIAQKAHAPKVTAGWLCLLILLTTACDTSKKTRVTAPLPPPIDMIADISGVPPMVDGPTLALAQNAAPAKSCSFSSFQRKNTIGYEWDESTHLNFTVSPSFDVWSMNDFDVKTSIRFTHALGGAANKRPCTFGSGYYGLVPYLANNEGTLTAITSPSMIKSLINDKIEKNEKKKADEPIQGRAE